MSEILKNANNSLPGYFGGEIQYKNPVTKLLYTEGIRSIAQNSNSYWFLDIIASYQLTLGKEYFQVWKLEREYSYTKTDGAKSVLHRKDCFNVTCDDGNGKILVQQHIPFSDFEFDTYTVWCVDGVALLPIEY